MREGGDGDENSGGIGTKSESGRDVGRRKWPKFTVFANAADLGVLARGGRIC